VKLSISSAVHKEIPIFRRVVSSQLSLRRCVVVRVVMLIILRKLFALLLNVFCALRNNQKQ